MRLCLGRLQAVARAFRWREMLEDGTDATIAETAAVEKNQRVLRRPSAADPSGARHSRDDSLWTAADGSAARGATVAVSGELAGTAGGDVGSATVELTEGSLVRVGE